MTLIRNTFDGGSNGVGMTTGNTGGSSGTAFTAVEPAAVFSNTQSKSGTLSMKPTSSAVTSYGRWAINDRDVAFRAYVYITAAHSADFFFAQPRTGTGNTPNWTLLFNGANELRIRDAASTILWTASASFPLNQWVRVEVASQIGTTDSSGSLQVAYYTGDSSTPIQSSGSLTGLDLRGDEGAATQFFLGKTSGSAYGGSIFIDDAAINTGSDYAGFIGATANSVPTVDAGVNQNVSAGATVNLSASASDSDGSIAAYAWSFTYPSSGAPSLTGGTTATPSFTAGSAGALYILQCQVTDNGGATATDTVEVRVPVAGGTEMRPLASDGTGSAGWTIGGGSATEGAALADSSDTTYVQSPAISGTPAPKRWRLQPSNDKTNPALALRLAMDSGTGNWTIRVYNTSSGGSPIQTFTQSGVGTTPTDYTFNITNSVSSDNWKQLWFEAEVVTP